MKSHLSPSEWLTIEAEEHNKIYTNMFPFNFDSYKIDINKVLKYEDYCYKRGSRKDRGHRTKKMFDAIQINNLKGKKVLDVGCGIGQYSVFFALHGADVYGIDISEVGVKTANMIAIENNVADSCYFEVKDFSNSGFQDNFFDIVIFHEVLHHAIKYKDTREETLRILKPSGKCFITESLYGNFIFAIGRKITMRGEENKGDVILTIKDLENFSRGFSERNIELFSLFFMIKRVFESWIWFPPVRLILFCTKKIDDIFLTIFPSFKKYCGETLVILKK